MSFPDSPNTPLSGRREASVGLQNSGQKPDMARTSIRNRLNRLSDANRESSLLFARRVSSNPQSSVGQNNDLKDIDLKSIVDLMEELDEEMIQLIGVEQQMNSISLKCRLIRENIMVKSNNIHRVLEQLAATESKQVFPKATQTDFAEPAKTVTNSNKLQSRVSHSPNYSLCNSYRKRRMSSVSEATEPLTPEPEEEESDHSAQELSNKLKIGLRRLPALVKGYLTRRLMKTDRVEKQIKTFREISVQIQNISHPPRPSDKSLLDIFIPHLNKSRNEIHDIFFKYSKAEQMSLIALKRENVLNKHFKNGIPISGSSYLNRSFHDSMINNVISSATKKVMERKANSISESVSVSKANKSLRNSSKEPLRKSSVRSPAKKPTTRSSASRQRSARKD